GLGLCMRSGAEAEGRGVASGEVRALWKEPLPLPSSTLTLSLKELATTRSGLPSPLTSATATEYGPEPTAKFWAFWKVPLPLPKSSEERSWREPVLAVVGPGASCTLRSG